MTLPQDYINLIRFGHLLKNYNPFILEIFLSLILINRINDFFTVLIKKQ